MWKHGVGSSRRQMREEGFQGVDVESEEGGVVRTGRNTRSSGSSSLRMRRPRASVLDEMYSVLACPSIPADKAF